VGGNALRPFRLKELEYGHHNFHHC
jgi:hypothetical protein